MTSLLLDDERMFCIFSVQVEKKHAQRCTCLKSISICSCSIVKIFKFTSYQIISNHIIGSCDLIWSNHWVIDIFEWIESYHFINHDIFTDHFNSYHPDPVPNATGHDIPCVNVNAANLIAFHHVWWLQAVGGQHASNFTRWSSLRSSSDLLDFCNASNTCVITPRDMHFEHESNRFSRVYVKWCELRAVFWKTNYIQMMIFESRWDKSSVYQWMFAHSRVTLPVLPRSLFDFGVIGPQLIFLDFGPMDEIETDGFFDTGLVLSSGGASDGSSGGRVCGQVLRHRWHAQQEQVQAVPYQIICWRPENPHGRIHVGFRLSLE